MAKVVIDISDRAYASIKKMVEYGMGTNLDEAVLKGTLLPDNPTNRYVWDKCQQILNKLQEEMETVSPMGIKSELKDWWDRPFKEKGDNE